MSKHKWDASLLRQAIQYLRVPELYYPFELGGSDALVERNKQTRQLLNSCLLKKTEHEESLVKEIQILFAEKGTFSQANNLAFLLDRTFDVWLRKNEFKEEINSILTNWRFLFYKLSLFSYASNLDQPNQKIRETALVDFISLLESITEFAHYWEPFPKRSQSILLDQLKTIEDTFDSHNEFEECFVATCLDKWKDFLAKQSAKVDKITERLILSEEKKNKSDFSVWLSFHYLNVLFKKRELPNVLQRFLQEFWVFIVAKEIEKTLPDDISCREAIVVSSYNEKLDVMCKNIVRVFCHRGESGFQLADQIIEDLQTMTQDAGFSDKIHTIDGYGSESSFFSIEEAWNGLSESLLSILQEKDTESIHTFKLLSVPDYHQKIFGDTNQFKPGTLNFSDLSISNGDWFVLNDAEGDRLIKFIADFSQSHQLLFSNYLGMKSAQLSYIEFDEALKNNVIKRPSKVVAFSSVFDQAIKGLSKIAENQKQARMIAAEKAKEEAERLLEDRRKADEITAQRVEEIAQRTKQLKAKREDKLRLEKETNILNIIRAFKLGAWIAIQTDGEAQRFKLVVKLAATGKYVFVDRLGVKKREFMEADLMQAIQTQQVEVLSDGAEFEDSLQRVVSRLRMSK